MIMGRKCSHCGKIGHNSRTCSSLRGSCSSISHSNSNSNSHSHSIIGSTNNLAGGVKLFGVQLEMPSATSLPMKKSFSLDCLPSPSSTPSSSTSSRVSADENSDKFSHGYLSADGLVARTQERKKGVPWSEEEHRTFLLGLERLGRGDWRGISRNFVTTRTPTQVASHAQKYFLRHSNLNKKKRRPSLFDLVESSTFSFHLVNPSISQPNQPSIPHGFSLKTTNSTLIDLNS